MKYFENGSKEKKNKDPDPRPYKR